MSATGATERTDAREADELLVHMSQRLERIDGVVERLEHRLEVLDELAEDLMPMANGMFAGASAKLGTWERDGVLEFVKEGAKIAETVATSFTAEDVALLGSNIVGILETIRGMTQPEVMDVVDRASTAVRQAEARPPARVRLLGSLRDPEVRRGMGLLLSVLKEMGTEPVREPVRERDREDESPPRQDAGPN